jgi:hypothetical protein
MPDSWPAPGFVFSGSTNGYAYGHPELQAAVARLAGQETAAGTWTLAETLSPFARIAGLNDPVILAFLGPDGQPAASALPPDAVAPVLAAAFAPALPVGAG